MLETKLSNNVIQHPRTVVRKFLARPQHEGVGAIVRRSIGRYYMKFDDLWTIDRSIDYCFLFHLDYFNWTFSFRFRFELKYFDPFLALDEFSGWCSSLHLICFFFPQFLFITFFFFFYKFFRITSYCSCWISRSSTQRSEFWYLISSIDFIING